MGLEDEGFGLPADGSWHMAYGVTTTSHPTPSPPHPQGLASLLTTLPLLPGASGGTTHGGTALSASAASVSAPSWRAPSSRLPSGLSLGPSLGLPPGFNLSAVFLGAPERTAASPPPLRDGAAYAAPPVAGRSAPGFGLASGPAPDSPSQVEAAHGQYGGVAGGSNGGGGGNGSRPCSPVGGVRWVPAHVHECPCVLRVTAGPMWPWTSGLFKLAYQLSTPVLTWLA